MKPDHLKMRRWNKKESKHNYSLSLIISVTLFHMQLFGCIDMAKALYHEGIIHRVTTAGFNGEKKACDATSCCSYN